MSVLILVDTVQVQRYVFASNKLRENIGASHLVHLATDDWSREACERAHGEPIYAGGGNFLAQFKEDASAMQFVRDLSLRCSLDAPGLVLAFGRHACGELIRRSDVEDVFKDVARRKRFLNLGSTPRQLPFTAVCASSGVGASVFDTSGPEDEHRWVSYEVAAKRSVQTAAQERLTKSLGSALGQGYTFPVRFEDLSNDRGDRRRVAVVHIDGNGIGQRIVDNLPDQDPRGWLRAFSESLHDAGLAALREAIAQVASHVIEGRISHPEFTPESGLPSLSLARDDDRFCLPLRPLVYGGDDLTFVCDDRIALSFTEAYLSAYERITEEIEPLGGKISVSAGVAMVGGSYPFASAYDLAEQLCSSAKARRRQREFDGNALDWYVTYGEIGGDLESMRAAHYKNADGTSITVRPMLMDSGHESWSVVRECLREFQGRKWQASRNKLKTLREVARGSQAQRDNYVSIYLAPSNKELPAPDGRRFIFSDDPFWYDALELIDTYIPLDATQ